jgi:hypothetical protein
MMKFVWPAPHLRLLDFIWICTLENQLCVARPRLRNCLAIPLTERWRLNP